MPTINASVPHFTEDPSPSSKISERKDIRIGKGGKYHYL